MNFDLPQHKIATRTSDGFIEVQPEPFGSLDADGNQLGTSPSYEALLPFGVMVRPKDPTDGVGTNLLTMAQGPEKRVFIGHDPRWMSVLPDFGDGGMAIYATTELAGEKKTPFIAVYGEGGAKSEGTFRIEIPTSAGTSSVEIDPSTGDITITHPSGNTITIKNTGVEIAGTQALALALPIETFASNVVSALAGLGVTVAPLVGASAMKAKGS